MPQMGLKDKVAIVTGAGSRGDGIGNGRAAAILLAREGAKVALLDAMKEWAEATKAMIDAEGGTSMVVIADVADQVSSAASVKATVNAWGRLDILVNNVGIGGPIGNAVDVDTAAWDAAMRVNVTSMMLMAKHAIPEMRKRGAGSIVNIASIDGLRGGNPSLFYSTSKGAVVNMTRSMAAHHGPEGIRVNCIAPGYVYTPMVMPAAWSQSCVRRAARTLCCRPRVPAGTSAMASCIWRPISRPGCQASSYRSTPAPWQVRWVTQRRHGRSSNTDEGRRNG